MTPKEIYQERILRFSVLAGKLQKRENRLSLARLIVFLTGLLLFFLLFSVSIAGAIVVLLVCMAVFGWLVKYFSNTEKLKEYYRHLETINHLEGQCLEGSFFEFADGSAYVNRNHPNSYDLDLFGHASVFQYINRTTSKPAADLLAECLIAPASQAEILSRQQAITELKPIIDWRQKLIALGYSSKNAGNDPEALVTWVQGENYFSGRRKLKIITNSLSALGLITTLFVISGLPAGLLMPVLVINFLFYFSQGRKITRLHQQVGRSAEMLQSYADTIALIEKESFRGNKLITLQNIFTRDLAVSTRIKRLSKLVSRLDARLNIMVAIPLNLFFLWDIHCCLALEKWKSDHRNNMPSWFSAMAEFEVLSGFSNMSFNNPDWIMPQVVPEYFILKVENAGHPLIPAHLRISNTFDITGGSGKTVIVTGSNMSGKSTFLRTCGVNAILALAGAPVCATSFIISHVQVFSSMRISDSLEDNTSSFYAELKKLAAIIKEAEHNPRVFLLLDEILRGTNSNDRFTGSVALIKQLISYDTVAIVATHDLKLAELATGLPDKIDNYHFDVKIDGEELYFDYKLTPGICTSLNASILMKKMGIRV